jgi:hypothetical protein
MSEHTPYQRKIIKRYYQNFDAIKQQRLTELVTDLYLAEGKKRDRLWTQVATILHEIEIPQSRIDHLLARRDVPLLAELVKEILAK